MLRALTHLASCNYPQAEPWEQWVLIQIQRLAWHLEENSRISSLRRVLLVEVLNSIVLFWNLMAVKLDKDVLQNVVCFDLLLPFCLVFPSFLLSSF